MPHRKDASAPRVTPTLRTSHAEQIKPAQPASGRVAFDERGNAVWEMRTADQRYVRGGSTTLVRKLVPPLSIEATGIVRKVAAASSVPKAGSPTSKRAVPTYTSNPYGTSHMGTVKTFPVRSAPAVKRAVPKSRLKSRTRSSLIDRLLGRKL